MKAIICALLIPALACGVAACDVKKTQEGKAPEVEVKDGQLPKYRVETGDVDVGSQKKEITVPTVDVDTPAQQRAEERAGKE